jgi:hypothetical protein
MPVSTQKAYISAITNFVPYGGEIMDACAPNYTACADAIFDFSRFHLSHLMTSGGSMDAYRSAWAAGGCTNKIANLMGYRLQISSVSHQGSVTRGDSITASVSIRNVGWSRVHRPRKTQLVLVNGGNTIICSSRVDLRNLPPQSTAYSTIAIPCTIPGGSATGTWTPHLRIPDIWPNTQSVAAFAIRPANSGTWDATNFRLATGTSLTVN